MNHLRYFMFFTLCLLPVVNTYAEVSLRDKIGQMIMVGFYGTEIPDSLKFDIENRNLGGIVTLANNLSSPAQILSMNETLQQLATTPLFISVDQEGGYVARLDEQNGFQATYSAFQLGTTFNSEHQTRSQAAKMAGWLQSVGLNLNLAPVVDVNVNPNSPAIGNYGRSFSNNSTTVSDHATWFIDEFNNLGIATALKHFPGHGSAEDDSHLGFTDVTNTWSKDELVPYEILIANGYSDMIMTGHLFNTTLDSLYPATLSKLTINGLLRDSLGYSGVIISDAMYMRAIQDNYEFDEAIELAIKAGVDILLYTAYLRDGMSLTGTIIDLVEEKILGGSIPESTINAAYNRIMTLKSRLAPTGVTPDKPVAPRKHSLRAFPNPFNGSTTISILLQQGTQLKLELLSIQGRSISILLEGQFTAGQHYLQLDGNQLASGIYLLRQTTDLQTITTKISLIK